ncbi:peptidoglycan-binding protein [Pedobacter sp. MC2016-15]|uniref:peptidoglycan-binding protein n=1 Tax=Pedobacter sp. MC2016-15 TaxID=2994473 RepID=UPI0022452DF0|nr:peptidoglycan-binding protein [Pedobacter sp. MC2016-15]MCX2477994.1 peptidoglycan-binding protein [Pedobacter sp. MC2016-15]
MSTTRILLGYLCVALAGSAGMPHRPLLTKSSTHEMVLRNTVVQLARQELGVREKTGNNDGARVATYLATVQLKPGQPWCAAFISFIFKQANLTKPRTGWSPDLFPASRLTKLCSPANLAGIYFSEYKRIAHVGLIKAKKGDWLTLVEGNTNVAGSRDGDGVYMKVRHIKTINKIADWITERRGGP